MKQIALHKKISFSLIAIFIVYEFAMTIYSMVTGRSWIEVVFHGFLFILYVLMTGVISKQEENKKSYKLFIDDERFPVDGQDWVIARTSIDAIYIIEDRDMPSMISFDHDLGGDDTAVKVVKWIINQWLDGEIKIPENFEFYVHSMNPIGAENIRREMGGFLDYVRRNT